MLKKIYFLLSMFFPFLLFISSCIPDEFTKDINTDILWTSTVNGPVAFGSLSLEDLLLEFDTTGFVDSDSTGLLYYAYRDSLGSFRADEWIGIPDADFPEVYFYRSPVDIPAALLGNAGDTLDNYKTENFDFVFTHSERIDSFKLKTGILHIDVISTIKHMGKLYITSDQIKMGHQNYSDTIIISDLSGSFEEHTTQILDGTTLWLDNQSDPDTAFLELKFHLELIHSGNDILSGEQVKVDMNFTDLEYQYIFGYLGDYDTLLIDHDTLDISLFEGEIEGYIDLANPEFNLYIDNSFGLPFGFELVGLKSYSNRSDITTDITFSPGYNPFILQAPDLDQVGVSIPTIISINKDISNIDEVANTDLSYFVYSVMVITNPEGEVSSNFILDSSRISVEYEMVLPMNLRAENFGLKDTVDFDLEEIIPEEDSDFEIESLQIRLETDNGMPVDINLLVTLTDSAYNVLDSLFTEENKNILPSGILDANGVVIAPTHNEIILDFPSDRIDLIRKTKYVNVNGSFETTNEGQTYVKFYSYYNVDFKLGAKADISLSTTGNK